MPGRQPPVFTSRTPEARRNHIMRRGPLCFSLARQARGPIAFRRPGVRPACLPWQSTSPARGCVSAHGLSDPSFSGHLAGEGKTAYDFLQGNVYIIFMLSAGLLLFVYTITARRVAL